MTCMGDAISNEISLYLRAVESRSASFDSTNHLVSNAGAFRHASVFDYVAGFGLDVMAMQATGSRLFNGCRA